MVRLLAISAHQWFPNTLQSCPTDFWRTSSSRRAKEKPPNVELIAGERDRHSMQSHNHPKDHGSLSAKYSLSRYVLLCGQMGSQPSRDIQRPFSRNSSPCGGQNKSDKRFATSSCDNPKGKPRKRSMVEFYRSRVGDSEENEGTDPPTNQQ